MWLDVHRFGRRGRGDVGQVSISTVRSHRSLDDAQVPVTESVIPCGHGTAKQKTGKAWGAGEFSRESGSELAAPTSVKRTHAHCGRTHLQRDCVPMEFCMSVAWFSLALLIASRADASSEVSLVSAPPKAEAIESLESDMVDQGR